jgi:hypothetical protein
MAEQEPTESALSAMLRKPPAKPVSMTGGNGSATAAATAAPSLIDRINEMANRDQEDWRYLTDTLRKFVAQRRADLDYLDRLLGTK